MVPFSCQRGVPKPQGKTGSEGACGGQANPHIVIALQRGLCSLARVRGIFQRGGGKDDSVFCSLACCGPGDGIRFCPSGVGRRQPVQLDGIRGKEGPRPADQRRGLRAGVQGPRGRDCPARHVPKGVRLYRSGMKGGRRPSHNHRNHAIISDKPPHVGTTCRTWWPADTAASRDGRCNGANSLRDSEARRRGR